MFVLQKGYYFMRKVAVTLPDGTTGDFDASFRPLTEVCPRELVEAGDESADKALVQETLIGWKRIKDEDGTAVPFDDDRLARLLSLTFWRRVVVLTYIEGAAGVAAKN